MISQLFREIGCTYNRRAFVFCVNETLANFSTAEEFTLSEYQQLIELVCPDFPKHIVLEAAHAIDSKSATSAKVAKFTHYDLRIAVFGQIIFEEWLKQIEKFFREMSSSSSHTSTRLRGHIVECRRLLPITIEQPTVAVIDGIMSEAFSSHSMEISYDDFRRAMFSNSFFAAAVTKVPLNAQPIISAPPATSDEGTSY